MLEMLPQPWLQLWLQDDPSPSVTTAQPSRAQRVGRVGAPGDAAAMALFLYHQIVLTWFPYQEKSCVPLNGTMNRERKFRYAVSFYRTLLSAPWWVWFKDWSLLPTQDSYRSSFVCCCWAAGPLTLDYWAALTAAYHTQITFNQSFFAVCPGSFWPFSRWVRTSHCWVWVYLVAAPEETKWSKCMGCTMAHAFSTSSPSIQDLKTYLWQLQLLLARKQRH